MTRSRLKNIKQEAVAIAKQLRILSVDNPIERQHRKVLFGRLDRLEYELDAFIASETGKHLTVI